MPTSSIRFKVTVPLLLLVLATGSVIAGLSYLQGRQAVNAVASKLHGEIADHIRDTVSGFLSLPHVVNEANAVAIGSGALDPNDPVQLRRHFWRQLKRNESLTSIYFGNLDGGLVGAGREGPEGLLYVLSSEGFAAGDIVKRRSDPSGEPAERLLSLSGFDARQRPWYEAAMASGGEAWSEVYVRFTGDGMAIAPSRLVRGADGRLLGVVATDISLSHITQTLLEVASGHPGYSFVMEPSGLLIASSAGELPFVRGESGEPARRLRAEESGTATIAEAARLIDSRLTQPRTLEAPQQLEVDIDGEPHLVTVAPLDAGAGLVWLIVLAVPEAAYLGEVVAGNKASIALIGGALLVAILLSLWLAFSIIRPLAELKSAAANIAQGNWSERIAVTGEDELGSLAAAFNAMAAQLEAVFRRQKGQIASTREAEALLRQVTENIHEVLWMSDVKKQEMLYVSPAYAEVWGMSVESHYREPMSYQKAIHPEDIARVVKAMPRQIQGDFDVDYRIVRPDGSIRWIRDRAFPVRDGKGEVYRIAGICEDITERKLIGEALTESEQRFRAAASQVSDLIYEWNLLDDSLAWFGDIDRLLGFPLDEAPDSVSAWEVLVHPDDLEQVLAAMDRALDAGASFDVEYRIRHKDGGWRVWRDRGGAETPPDGQAPLRWFGAISDITEQKESERAVAESERQLATLLDNLPGGAYRVRNDEAWTADYVSAGYLRMVGQALPAEKTGLFRGGDHPRVAVRPDELERVRRAIADAIAEGRPYEFEYPALLGDGEEHWIWERGRCVSPPGVEPEILEGIVFDITEQSKLEERLRSAQKMEAVGQLTGGVAHDFNNLLAIILGNLELAEELRPEAGAGRLIATAIRAAERGSELTRQLLAFGRRQTLRPEDTDLNALIHRLESLLRRSLGAPVEIETRLAPGLPLTLVDRGQLENAILNLALNARDAMPEGGRLTIETEPVDLDESALGAEAELAVAGRYVMLAVTDQGSGMAAEVAARAFEPFFTTKEVGKGTGLGLAMVYGFVRQSGGFVRIHSEPGKGTAVKLYLPESLAEVEASSLGEARYQPSRGGERVLLVEDEPEVRELVALQLGKLGYGVATAVDGESALATLDGDAGIDILLTDVILPGKLRGPELAERALAARPGLAIAFMSGYPEGALSRESDLPPDVQLLTKPFRMDDLDRQLRKALEAVSRDGAGGRVAGTGGRGLS